MNDHDLLLRIDERMGHLVSKVSGIELKLVALNGHLRETREDIVSLQTSRRGFRWVLGLLAAALIALGLK